MSDLSKYYMGESVLSSSTGHRETGGIVVASTSLAELFEGLPIKASDGSVIEGRLYLPEYQRPYRWTEKELGRLLEDCRAYFEPGQGESLPSHAFYLGSIILHQNQEAASDQSLLNIIDGQQRITSMALLAYALNEQGAKLPIPELAYSSPISQNRIKENLRWLQQLAEKKKLPLIELDQVNITLVVTRSEDDAYHFFETQNTGGVRLGGPDIIKAHHLRATGRHQQNHYARLWEEMGGLDVLVAALMRGRYWQALRFRKLSSYRQPAMVRSEIVAELAEATTFGDEDTAYLNAKISRLPDGGRSQLLMADGYAMRQPLNGGVNSIHYLQFFHQLRQQLLVDNDLPDQQNFYHLYDEIIVKTKASPFLKGLYESALLLYASQFGVSHLYEASLWLFRLVYSKRLSNQKMVRESTVQAFCDEVPVLDWIASSFTHDELVAHLVGFTYEVDSNNLDRNSVKKRFVNAVDKFFELGLPDESDQTVSQYDGCLKQKILLNINNHKNGRASKQTNAEFSQ